MAFNPVGAILCRRSETFVDGRDCIKCGWEQEPYVPDYTQKLIDLVKEGIDDLQAVGAYAESAGLEMQLLELLKEMNHESRI